MLTGEDIARLYEEREENEMMIAFLKWWNKNFDWDFSERTGGIYEAHAIRCFKAGWEAHQH